MTRIATLTLALALSALPGLAGGEEQPFLGVSGDTLGPELREAHGVPADVQKGFVVVEVVEDSGAAKAGLRVGDVIVRLGDREIAGFEDVRAEVLEHEVGEKLEYVLRRGAETLEGTAVLGAAPEREIVEVEVVGPEGRLPRVPRFHRDVRRALTLFPHGEAAGLDLERWIVAEEEALRVARRKGDEARIHRHEIRLELLREMRASRLRAMETPETRLDRLEAKVDRLAEMVERLLAGK